MEEKSHGIPENLPTDSNATLVESSISIKDQIIVQKSIKEDVRSIEEDVLENAPPIDEERPREPSPSSTPTVPAASSPSQNGPPNGGFRAWTQVIGSFCLYFCTWGLVSAYGSFQTIYENGPLKTHSSFQISIIGSLQMFLMVFLGLFAGPIYDAGYFRHLLAVGSLFVTAGTLLQSFSVHFWQYLLTQGVLVGVGAGCLSLLSVAVPSLWFTTKLPLANGIAATGSGLGGVLLPIMTRELNARIGLAWAARSIAFMYLSLLTIANLVLKVPSAKKKRRSFLDKTALKDKPYILVVIGYFTVFLGLYTPFVHIQSYALKNHVTSPRLSLYILAILNASSIFGRILPILVAQRVGPMNMMTMVTILLSVISLCLSTATNLPRLIVAILSYGFFTGTYFALQPTIFVRLASDPSTIGTRFGMAFSVMSIALLMGPPISGALLGRFGYTAAWTWSGIAILAGGCLIWFSRISKVGSKLRQTI